MKKVFSIISAGVIALMATSCIQEQLATFDPSNATAPVLGSSEIGAKNVTVDYTPAVFNLGFNEQIAPNHALALVSVDGKAVSKIVSSKDSGSTLTATLVNISKALTFFGYAEGDVVSSLELAVRATLQNVSQDNGVNGYIDSDSHVTLSNFTVTIPTGSPYADYTESCTWSVIGALSAYEMSWDKDLEMWTTADGDKFVAKAVTIKKDDQFKFRKDQAWDDNYGAPGDVEPYVVSVDTEFAGAGGGKNLAVPADGVYDLWLDLSGSEAVITVTEAYMAYPDHKDASTWSVIGALSAYEISWDGDLAMTTDGSTYVAQGIKLSKDDQFKFRKDAAWDTNFGATGDVEPFVVTLGSETAAAAGGKNLAVPEDGIFDLILNPDGPTFTVTETLGGGVSGIIGGNEPEPDEPAGYTGWGIIGVGGDWENDVAMTESDGVWTGYANIKANEGFKLRKDAGWDENCGAAGDVEPYVLTIGTPITGVANGKNLAVPADGFYKISFNASTLEITVSEGDVWGVIGQFNGWGGDSFMTLTDGKWVSPTISLVANEGFKLRHNAGWDDNRGAEGDVEPYVVTLNTAVTAVANGKNLAVEADGDYIVTYDPSAETITVAPALPSNTWSVIGVNGDWNNDHFMTEVMPGIWVSDMLEITTEGWKVRFNHGWDVNRGGATPDAVGKFVEGIPGGDNINLTGTFKVVYNAQNGTIGTLGFGVTGSIAAVPAIAWTNDVPMNLASDGKWYSVPVTLADGDEIKIRFGAGWDENYGGAATAADTAFDAVAGGDNIKAPAAGTYMIVYDPAEKKITLSTNFWGLIGVNGDWNNDFYMSYDGAGKWSAYHMDISGGWKVRKSASWDVNYGGVYAAAGEAITGVSGGDNIAVTDLTNFSVVFDEAAATITVLK